MKTFAKIFLAFLLGTTAVSAQEVVLVDEIPKDVHAKIRIGVNGGVVYRIAKLSGVTEGASYEQVNDFFQRMRLGGTFCADITYFFQPEWGFGMQYSVAGHSHNINNLKYYPYGTASYLDDKGVIDDKMTIQFIAPSFVYRLYTYRNSAFLASLAAGYVSYSDNYSCPKAIVDTGYQGKELYRKRAASGTFGIRLGVGYDLALNETWALGVQLSGLFAARTKEKQTIDGNTETIDLSQGGHEDNLARLELTIGLRFNK